MTLVEDTEGRQTTDFVRLVISQCPIDAKDFFEPSKRNLKSVLVEHWVNCDSSGRYRGETDDGFCTVSYKDLSLVVTYQTP